MCYVLCAMCYKRLFFVPGQSTCLPYFFVTRPIVDLIPINVFKTHLSNLSEPIVQAPGGILF